MDTSPARSRSGASRCVALLGPGQTWHSTTSRGHLQRIGRRSLTPRLTTSRVDHSDDSRSSRGRRIAPGNRRSRYSQATIGSRAGARPGPGRSRHGGMSSRFAGCERTGHGHPHRQGARRRGLRPRSLARRCVTRAVPSWIHCPPPCSTAVPDAIHADPAGRGCRQSQEPTRPRGACQPGHSACPTRRNGPPGRRPAAPHQDCTGDGIRYLPAQHVGATVSEVNVADIQQSTRVVPRRESLLADVQGSTQPDFQLSAEPRPSPPE